MVRLTLLAADFEPWLGIHERFPSWALEPQQRLERIGEEDPAYD